MENENGIINEFVESLLAENTIQQYILWNSA